MVGQFLVSFSLEKSVADEFVDDRLEEEEKE